MTPRRLLALALVCLPGAFAVTADAGPAPRAQIAQQAAAAAQSVSVGAVSVLAALAVPDVPTVTIPDCNLGPC